MKNLIAGIGSRSTPNDILKIMMEFAKWFAGLGGYIRSGHADGADTAFEYGAKDHCIVYLPWKKFGGEFFTRNVVLWDDVGIDVRRKALESLYYHPNPDSLSNGARLLMARNYLQVFGTKTPPVPVQAILCWTPNGRGGGGTGQAIRIALANNIPVFDLGDTTLTIDMVKDWILR